MNINKITTDVEDNKASNKYRQPIHQYQGITVLVVGTSIAVLVFWLMFFLVMRADCYFNIDCTITTYIFYGYNIVLAAGLLTGLLFLIGRLYQAFRNSAFLRGMSLPLHRNDWRSKVDAVLGIEYRLAESEYLRGLDAQTIHNSSTIKEADKSNNAAGIYSPHVKAQDEVDVLEMLAALKKDK